MTDAVPGDRPRPQYGEYATPEEQAARIRHPLPVPPPVARSEAAPATAAVARAALSPGRILDRATAVALLVYGLLSFVNAIPAILEPASLLTALGLDADDFDVTSVGGWGIAAAVVLVVGWIVTAWLTWLAHRRGWILFWVPLAGGVVFNAISGALVTFALLSDPAIFDAVLRQAGG
ncbi:DUF6264 family protein [Microbacterium rhizophilus]|uniref:DUF6264 family protein n=1 Tax=Microbacterium rhizophilus TaxID=3138934 RepID=UPI0031E6A23B